MTENYINSFAYLLPLSCAVKILLMKFAKFEFSVTVSALINANPMGTAVRMISFPYIINLLIAALINPMCSVQIIQYGCSTVH